MDWILLTVSGLTLLISAYTFHKVRRIHLATFEIREEVQKTRRETDVLYSQLAAYDELNRLLKFRWPLPPLRGWAASPDFLLEIAKDALQRRPETIVECSSGSTTLTLARCCELNGNGHVYSLEHDPEYAAETRSRLREQGLEPWATVIDAPLVAYKQLGGQFWYSLDGLVIQKPIDLLVIDGPPWNTAPLARYPALPMFNQMLSPTVHIFLDDADREEETATLKRWKEESVKIEIKKISNEKGAACLLFPK